MRACTHHLKGYRILSTYALSDFTPRVWIWYVQARTLILT